MKASVLASGSKGNCTYIETRQHKFLVDLGTTSLYVEKKLKELSVEPSEIEAIFLTHTHVDHISGLRVFIKKYHPTLYVSEIMYREMRQSFPDFPYQMIDDSLTLDELKLTVFKTSHDVDDSNGYLFEEENSSIVYITDTGYLNQKYFPLLKNRSLYIMESNHDIQLLMEGSYPYHLKQRILGDRGHLSNKDSSYYLSKLIGPDTKEIILIHLSEENNDETIAYQTCAEKITQNIPIVISHQKEHTELVEI
ncbi:MAG: MBL fold metallo-hydrolase [Firmicutes bacterium]|nr:MBL fold metallo-hydrolase [Bacillota bacterium]